MHLAYTAEQEALRRELRQYFQALMTPEVETECAAGETGGPASLEAVRKMGRDGWLGLGGRTEWGGQGGTDVARRIFFNEAGRSKKVRYGKEGATQCILRWSRSHNTTKEIAYIRSEEY